MFNSFVFVAWPQNQPPSNPGKASKVEQKGSSYKRGVAQNDGKFTTVVILFYFFCIIVHVYEEKRFWVFDCPFFPCLGDLVDRLPEQQKHWRGRECGKRDESSQTFFVWNAEQDNRPLAQPFRWWQRRCKQIDPRTLHRVPRHPWNPYTSECHLKNVPI